MVAWWVKPATSMGDAPRGDRGGDRGGFGRGFGDRGRGRGERGRGRGDRGRGRGGKDKEEWIPCTKLGRLVKDGKIKSLEQIFLFSIPIKEFQIVDMMLGDKLKDEAMQIMPVQKQTSAGQRTRFRAFIAVGDYDGHIGLGVKCSKEVAGAIAGGIINAKCGIVPVRRGYWGAKIGLPHTVPIKLTGKCGSVRIRLVPAARGTGIVASPTSKKILQMAGVQDCYTASQGHTKTKGNFAKCTFDAVAKSYGFLTPDLWRETKMGKPPVQEYTDYLAKTHTAKKAVNSLVAPRVN
tara:strand:- start:597 stop:1475 length:879 start_codon:yes stop_codon:yes gene_type:complete